MNTNIPVKQAYKVKIQFEIKMGRTWEKTANDTKSERNSFTKRRLKLIANRYQTVKGHRRWGTYLKSQNFSKNKNVKKSCILLTKNRNNNNKT